MPLVAHIDDEPAILDGAVQVCSEIAASIAICEAALSQHKVHDDQDPQELSQLFRSQLKRHKLDEAYSVVADMMAAAHGGRASIKALGLSSIQDVARLIERDDPDDISDLIAGSSIVMTAQSGNDFLTQLKHLKTRDHPSLIILDLKLDNNSDSSGLDLLNTIREYPTLKYVPVVMFTQHYEEKYVHLGYKNGASSYHLKGGTQLEANLIHILATWLILAKLPTPGME